MLVKGYYFLLKLFLQTQKMFLSPRRAYNPQPSDLQWDALTIELPGLRWQREGYDVYWFVCATYVLLSQHSYVFSYVYTLRLIGTISYILVNVI